MKNKNTNDDGVHWVDGSQDIITKNDEKTILWVYRGCRVYWQFLLGLVIGLLLGLVILK